MKYMHNNNNIDCICYLFLKSTCSFIVTLSFMSCRPICIYHKTVDSAKDLCCFIEKTGYSQHHPHQY